MRTINTYAAILSIIGVQASLANAVTAEHRDRDKLELHENNPETLTDGKESVKFLTRIGSGAALLLATGGGAFLVYHNNKEKDENTQNSKQKKGFKAKLKGLKKKVMKAKEEKLGKFEFECDSNDFEPCEEHCNGIRSSLSDTQSIEDFGHTITKEGLESRGEVKRGKLQILRGRFVRSATKAKGKLKKGLNAAEEILNDANLHTALDAALHDEE